MTVGDTLAADARLAGLHVDVDVAAGVVTLRGHAPDGREALRAVSLARSTPGVKRVVSEIELNAK